MIKATETKQDITRWQQYYYNIGLPPALAGAYVSYVRILLEKNLPPIFEFNHLAGLLGRTGKYLASVINSSDSHYREFSIPKRSGGVRTICAPYPALLECQQWINKNILGKVAIHESAHGFIPGRSILSNAQEHASARQMLKIDLKDFFPSISVGRVIGVFQSLGYPKNVSFYLSGVCCKGGALPQGAATSPSLSNIVCRKMDVRLNKAALKCGLCYTRYADDIVFSGDDIPRKFINLAAHIITAEGFRINSDKVRFIRKDSGKRIITGLNVSGGEVRAPSQFKRAIRQEYNFIKKYGLLSHMTKKKIRDPFYIDRLIGKFSFLAWVEPDNAFATEALSSLKEISLRLERISG